MINTELNNNDNMNVFIAVTKNYVIHAIELIYTLRKYSIKHLNIYLMIDCTIITEYQDIFNELNFDNTKVTVLPSTLLDQKLNLLYRTNLSKMTYARLLIFDMFKDMDRMLYLDGDMLIKNFGLDELYDRDFNDKYAFVVEELSMELFNTTELNDCGVKRYFNAGFMLLNIKHIIEDGIDKKCIELLEHPLDFLISRGYADQSIVNMAFYENVEFVDPAYNSLIIMAGYTQYSDYCKKFGYADQNDMYNKCIVSHMMGAKPWEPRWNTWQSWQIPYRQWQKDYYIQIMHEVQEKYPQIAIFYNDIISGLNTLKVFNCYSFNAPVIPLYAKNPSIFIPVGGGGYHNDYVKLSDCDYDDDNISQLNKYYNEATVIYWVGKHIAKLGNPEYIGFGQYRRALNIDTTKLSKTNILCHIDAMEISVYKQYVRDHIKTDIDKFIQLFNKNFPSLINVFNEFLQQNNTYSLNMFVMHKDSFERYFNFYEKCIRICQSMFDISELDTRSDYQRRAPAFLLERMTGFWIWLDNKNKGSDLQIMCPIIYSGIQSPYQTK